MLRSRFGNPLILGYCGYFPSDSSPFWSTSYCCVRALEYSKIASFESPTWQRTLKLVPLPLPTVRRCTSFSAFLVSSPTELVWWLRTLLAQLKSWVKYECAWTLITSFPTFWIHKQRKVTKIVVRPRLRWNPGWVPIYTTSLPPIRFVEESQLAPRLPKPKRKYKLDVNKDKGKTEPRNTSRMTTRPGDLGFHNFTLPRHSKIKSVQPG